VRNDRQAAWGQWKSLARMPQSGPSRLEGMTIQRSSRAARCQSVHMRVDHDGGHVRMTQQLLHRADIGATLQQRRGKRGVLRVNRYWLADCLVRHTRPRRSGNPHAARSRRRFAAHRLRQLPLRLHSRVCLYRSHSSRKCSAKVFFAHTVMPNPSLKGSANLRRHENNLLLRR